MRRESKRAGRGGAAFVALGILLSRISGFLRETLFAYAFGNSAAADAFKGALRIPNLLQNLLGEGVLSASFIPVYAKLRGAGSEIEAKRLAGAVLGLLAAFALVVSILGILFAPTLVDIITPGFEEGRRELAISLVRIFFPGTALLVLSAWCLGILNSHGSFFLPYVAPVFWNGTIIVALLLFQGRLFENDLAEAVAYGVLAGSFAQLAVQLPAVWKLLGGIRLSLNWRSDSTRQVLQNFLPVVTGRGVVQISAFIDSMIASLLAVGSVAALAYAQMIYLLPVSLFGMSVSAAELPQMSTVVGGAMSEDRGALVIERLRRASRQVLFFVVPSAVFLISFGRQVVAALYQYGRFSAADTELVAVIVSALALALPLSTLSRLYSSSFYALGDPKTPLRGALLRVTFGTVSGAALALWLFPHWRISIAATGLALGSTVGSFIEWGYLRSRTVEKLGEFSIDRRFVGSIVGGAVLGALVGYFISVGVGELPAVVRLIVVGSGFGLCYLGVTIIAKLPEVRRIPGMRKFILE